MACAVWPALRWLRIRPLLNAAALMAGLLVSFVPTAFFNQKYAGDWAGDPRNLEGMAIRNPLAGLVGNGLQLAEQTLLPPISIRPAIIRRALGADAGSFSRFFAA